MLVIPPGKFLILFDGVCNLCNASVNFIMDRDQQNRFVFASLQSDLGQSVLRQYAMPLTEFETVLLFKDQQLFTRSTAALQIAAELKWPWKVLRVFLWLPSWLRDPLYVLVAKNRYRLFGQRQTCRVPTSAEKEKILG